MNSKIYINKIKLSSNVISKEQITAGVNSYSELKEIVPDYIKFKLLYEHGGCRIDLEFNPSLTVESSYKNAYIDYEQFKKNIKKVQRLVKKFNLDGLEKIENWTLEEIEIAKDVTLKHSFSTYIDAIKMFNPRRIGIFSVLVDYDDSATIYFNHRKERDSINSKKHIRFVNKAKLANKASIEQTEEERTLQCVLNIKKYDINPYIIDEIRDRKTLFCLMLRNYYSPIFDTVPFQSIISDCERDFLVCSRYLEKMLSKYLFKDHIEVAETTKDDEYLLNRIVEKTGTNSEKHLLYFIAVKILSELKNYHVKSLLKLLPKSFKSKKYAAKNTVIDNLSELRRYYKKDVDSIGIEDLVSEIKHKLLPASDI